jgi:uncharacterized protein (TIGR03790 family)
MFALMPLPARIALWTFLIGFAFCARAGNSGLNVVVVVNQNSTNSVQLGNAYCEQRGVPPQNLFRMTGWTGGNVLWTRADFESLLLNPLLAMLAQRGLATQAQVVLLSMDIPYAVGDGFERTSTTSALFYGFKTNGPAPLPCLPGGCALPATSFNSYSFSEMPFALAPPANAFTNAFLAMMLTASNLNDAKLILSRGVAGDSTFPTQTVYLATTSDNARDVRTAQFDNALMAARVRGNDVPVWVYSDSTSYTNALGLLTGLANLTLPANAFVAGAMGDSLTSYGGQLFEDSAQTSLLAFLVAGAAASYGTITEPCNYTQKFPDPLDYFFQHRGFSVVESYYQSLQNPYQGLLGGEPLSAPFAQPGAAVWTLTNNTPLSGTVPLSPAFLAAAPQLPIGQVNLFIDGTFARTLTNVPPAPGNQISVTLNGISVTNTIETNATLFTAVTNLANALNAQSNLTRVVVFPVGDRLELQSFDPATAGSNLTLQAGASLGTGARLTTSVLAARTNFIDTAATGYLGLLVTNSPAVGDWLRLDFIKTNGATVSVAVTNTVSGAGIATLLLGLGMAVNTNAALNGSDGLFAWDLADDTYCGYVGAQFTLYARSPGYAASQIQVSFTASPNLAAFPGGTNRLEDNVNDLRPRNHLYLSAGDPALAVNHAFDTTLLADGFHDLTAVAYEGTSVRTQTRVTRTVRIQNTGLSATFTSLLPGTNATLAMPAQFQVAASATNIARIDFLGTGGLLGTVSNQASALFTAPAATLGLGLHPFRALVTDTAGNQYQTETRWIRFVPEFQVGITRTPLALAWAAQPGQPYDILVSTNLASPFQLAGTITPATTNGTWNIAGTNGPAAFYRVRFKP